MGRDEVRVDPQVQEAQAVGEVVLPDRGVPLGELLAAPDVVDQYVQPARLGPDALHQPLHLLRHQVVDPQRDAPPAGRGDQVRRLLDRLRAGVLGLLRARRPPGDVDGGPGRAQLHGDPPPRPARPAGDQRHLPLQRLPALLSARPRSPLPVLVPVLHGRPPLLRVDI